MDQTTWEPWRPWRAGRFLTRPWSVVRFGLLPDGQETRQFARGEPRANGSGHECRFGTWKRAQDEADQLNAEDRAYRKYRDGQGAAATLSNGD